MRMRLVALGMLLCCALPLVAGCGGDDADPVSRPPIATPLGAQGVSWRPTGRLGWQYQLSGTVDTSIPADVYDVDGFEAGAALVAQLHAQGRHALCYINVGAWEDWRPDAAQFPSRLIGKDYTGWAGEKWLDIRQLGVLGPLLDARMDMCKAKGFDGVEPDNVDGYTNQTGFPLTAADQLAFNRWLADQAHQRGLSIGLKNDPDQIPELVTWFDWALTEDCFAQHWSQQVKPFVEARKSVFAVEYTDTGMTRASFCSQAQALGVSAILKRRDLDAWRESC